MLHIIASEDGQFDGTSDAVIGTEGGSLCLQPFAVNVGLDGILVKVKFHVHQFVAYHIEVALQDDRLAVFHSWCGRFAYDHVARFVDAGVELVAFAPVFQILDHLLFTLRRARNLVDFGKLFKDTTRF